MAFKVTRRDKEEEKEIIEEKIAEKNRELVKNRHHFKDITFSSSLTNKNDYICLKEK